MTADATVPDTSLWKLIERRAKATPDAPMMSDGTQSLTFGAFARRAEHVAAGLHLGHGIREGTVVAWQLPSCVNAMVAMAALCRVGAIQVPIIPALRERELAAIASASQFSHLIVPRTWRDFDYAELAGAVAGSRGADVIVIDDVHAATALPAGDPDRLPAPTAHGDTVRWIYFSSGTTAEPKGCRHTDRSVMYSATGLVERFGFSPADMYPIAYPVAHVGGLSVLTAQLVAGNRISLFDVFDGPRSAAVMSAQGATVLGSALPFFRAYIDAQRATSTRLFPRLRGCIGGGAARPPGLHAEVKATLGGAGVVGTWGLTEFPIATFGSLDDSDEQLSLTEGRPVRGVTVRVVDADGRHAQPGAEGELVLRGPQQFRGYLDPTMDRDALTPDGWFRTGDIGIVWPTGHVQISGRLKDVIIRNAENISALEVENVLRTHPKIVDVAVIGVPDARTGEHACAVVVLTPGCDAVSVDELGAHCLANGLSPQKQPEQVHTVAALPRNSMGKVLKRELVRSLTR